LESKKKADYKDFNVVEAGGVGIFGFIENTEVIEK
jgi:hypothetical protein